MFARGRQQHTGFTLVEILLATAILSVIATMVIPSFLSRYHQHREMDQAVAGVMESIQTAKKAAIESSTPCVYEFTRGTGLQEVYLVNQPQRKQQFRIPAGLRLELLDTDSASVGRMLFREDGSTDDFRMAIVGKTQSKRIWVLRHLGIPQLESDPVSTTFPRGR